MACCMPTYHCRNLLRKIQNSLQSYNMNSPTPAISTQSKLHIPIVLSPSPTSPPQATTHDPHPGLRTPSPLPKECYDQSNNIHEHQDLKENPLSQTTHPWTCVRTKPCLCSHVVLLSLADTCRRNNSTSATSPSNTRPNAGTAHITPVESVSRENK